MAEPASPVAGSIQGIRRSVSSSMFAGGGLPGNMITRPDPTTTTLIQNNSLLVRGLTGRIGQLENNIAVLTSGLNGLQQSLALSQSLERQREEAKAKRDFILAQQALREGKESAIESKIVNALTSPVRRIGSKVQSSLANLQNFLGYLVGGWFSVQALSILKARAEGNTQKLGELRRKLYKNLLFVGGTLLLLKSGLGLILRTLSTVGKRIALFSINRLVKAPLIALTGLLSRLFGGIFGKGAGKAGSFQGGVSLFGAADEASNMTKKQKTKQLKKNKNKWWRSNKRPSSLGAKGLGINIGIQSLLFGKDIKDTIVDESIAFGAGKIVERGLRKKFGVLADIGGILTWISVSEILNFLRFQNSKESSSQSENQTSDNNSGINASLMSPISAVDLQNDILSKKPQEGDYETKEEFNRANDAFALKYGDQLQSLQEDINSSGDEKIVANQNNLQIKKNDKQINQLQEPAPLIVPMNAASNAGQSSGSSPGGSTSSGSGEIPDIASSNGDNDYVFLAYKQFQVAPV